jgi:hypothetical protein
MTRDKLREQLVGDTYVTVQLGEKAQKVLEEWAGEGQVIDPALATRMLEEVLEGALQIEMRHVIDGALDRALQFIENEAR